MNVNYRSIVILFVFFLSFFLIEATARKLFFKKTNMENSTKKMDDKIIGDKIIENNIIFPSDYEIGFQVGKSALYSQLGKSYEPKGDAAFAYSSFIEDDYSKNEEYDKGYVDGYHKAIEEVYCPAGQRGYPY